MKRALPFLIALPLLLAACGKGDFSKRGTKARTNALRYALGTSPTTLDPGKVQDTETGDLLSNVFEGLVAYDEQNRIVPRLAEGWTVEDGGRTYVFRIKPGVKFHNGRELVAADLKWSIERSLNPTLSSPTAAHYLTDIVGAKERLEEKTEAVKGIQAPDDRTLRITLDKPRPYFLGKLTYPCAFALAKEATPQGEITTPAQAIGTGPFRLAASVREQAVSLAAHEAYHGGKPAVERIERPIILDTATRLNKYRSGELDFLTLDRGQLGGVEADPALKNQLTYFPRPTVFYVSLIAPAYAPFKDRRVRRAVAMAIDRETISRDLLHGMPPAQGLIPPGVMGHRPDFKGLPYDPAAARALLAEAGHPNGKGLPPLSIFYREQAPASRILVEGVQAQLRQNLGLEVAVRPMVWGALLAARNKRELPMIHNSWVGDYLDPQNFLSLLLSSTTSQNWDGYKNPEFDRLCAEADASLDEAKRLALYQKAEDIVIQDAPRVPIYYGRDAILVSPRVKGLRTNLFGLLPHTTVRVEG